jgi:hypothetical protein
MFWKTHCGKIVVTALAVMITIWVYAAQAVPPDVGGGTVAQDAASVVAGDRRSGDETTDSGSAEALGKEAFIVEEAPAETEQAQAESGHPAEAEKPRIQQPQPAPPQPQPQPPPPESVPLKDLSIQSFNTYVLDIVNTYQGRDYPYLFNTDYQNYNGVTTTLEYKGWVLARAHPSGNRASHCTGITFEVFFKAMQQRNIDLGLDPGDFNGMTFDELFDFLLHWYMAGGAQAGHHIVAAVEKYGLGMGIADLEEARPGDFMQFGRENNTGHTVVFIEWLRDSSGHIIGLHHWSSQCSTNGIAYKKEYFNIQDARGHKYGNVRMDTLRIARVQP